MINHRIVLFALGVSGYLHCSESEVIKVPQKLHLLADQRRAVSVDFSWKEYSQWIKERCISEQIGTIEQRLEVPFALEKILVLELLLSYIRSHAQEGLKQEQLHTMGLKELAELYRITDLLKMSALMDPVETTLIARLRERATVQEFSKSDQFLSSLGFSQAQSTHLGSLLLSAEEKLFFRTQLYTDITLKGAPVHVALSHSGLALIVTSSYSSGLCFIGDIYTGEIVLEFSIGSTPKGALFAETPNILVWTSKQIQLWNSLKKEGENLCAWSGFPQAPKNVSTVAMNGSKSLIAAAIDGQLFLGSVVDRSFNSLAPIHDDSCKSDKMDEITQLFFVAGEQILVACSASGAVTFYRCRDGRLVGHMHEHKDAVVHHFVNGDHLITMSKDNEYCVWSCSLVGLNGLLKKGMIPEGAAVFASPGVCVPVKNDSKITLCEGSTEEFFDKMPFLDPQYEAERGITVASNGTLFAADPGRRTGSGQRIELPGTLVQSICLSPDGAALAGVAKERIRVWHYFNEKVKEHLDRGLTLDQALVLKLLVDYCHLRLKNQADKADGSFLELPHLHKQIATISMPARKLIFTAFPELNYALGEECFQKGKDFYPQAGGYYLKAAAQEKNGYIRAQAFCRLGEIAYQEATYKEAFSFFLKAKQLNNGDACWWLGELYRRGWGVPHDFVQARTCYRHAEKDARTPQLRGQALSKLGWMCDFGQGGEVDADEAFAFFVKALNQSVPLTVQAEVNLLVGLLCNQDNALKVKEQLYYEAAYQCAQQVLIGEGSEYDKAPAMNILGRIYLQALGRLAHLKQAESYYLRVDQSLNPVAQPEAWRRLGEIYGQLKDYVKQRFYIKKAARQSIDLWAQASALNSLGDMYSSGLGVQQNDSKAALCYGKVVEQTVNGYAQAIALEKYGKMLAEGTGVKKDLDKAIKCEERAILQKYESLVRVRVALRYGQMLSTGKSYLMKNSVNAVKYFTIVAEESTNIKQLEVAWNQLGELFTCGDESVNKDHKKAKAYFELIVERSKNEELLADAWFRLGEFASLKNQRQEALEYLNKAAGQSKSSWARESAQKILAQMSGKK